MPFHSIYMDSIINFLYIKVHVELLRQYKHEGYKIVVWSAAGANWAKEISESITTR